MERIAVSRTGALRILEVFQKYDVQATFFVTAHFAESCPELVADLVHLGHEVANHGLFHYPPVNGDPAETYSFIMNAGSAIESLTGKRVVGFRKPFLNLDRSTIVALERLDYLYDSSVLPFFVPGRYNNSRLSSSPFFWKKLTSRKAAPILELPVSVVPKLNLPVGWWWFRKNFGNKICQVGFRAIWKNKQPVICHIHPWEAIQAPEAAEAPLHLRFNCGDRSLSQLEETLKFSNRYGAHTITMVDLVRDHMKLVTETTGPRIIAVPAA